VVFFTDIFYGHLMISFNETYKSIICIHSEEIVHCDIVRNEFVTFPS
jgi:hypothetical protein